MAATIQEKPAEKAHILLVCEDEDNLEYMHEILGAEYILEVAEDAEDAIELLEDKDFCQKIQAVIVDEDLDLGEGVELLDKAHRKAPLAQRVFITESADAKSLIEAINRGRIFKFVLKPFTPEEMLNIARLATATCRIFRHREAQLEELNTRHRELKHQMIERLDDLTEVLRGLRLPPIRDCEVFAHEAGVHLPSMLESSEEMVRILEGDDKDQITALAHRVHTQALALNTSFESLIQDVRDNQTPLPRIQTPLPDKQ